MTTSQTGRSSFTLIELLFVIAIIAILAVASFPGLRKTFNNLQLENSAKELQSFINYLQQRSVSEGKIIYLNIDSENKGYWAQLKDSQNRIRSFSIPQALSVSTQQKQVAFYPDGKIDPFTIKLTSPDVNTISLTTEGVFGGVKVKSQ
jgi:type II secretion system protein H